MLRTTGGVGPGESLQSATMVLVCTILVWAPLPLGSNRPWSWSLLGAATVLGLSLWTVAQLLGARPRARAAWPVALAATVTVPVWAWAYLQTIPALPYDWLTPNPVWAAAINAGTTSATPLVGLDAVAGRDALMRLITYAAMFWLGWRLALNASRARWLLTVVLATASFCATYGLVAQLMGWEAIFWIPKTAYLGDVTGTFVNRNSFATYANLGVVLALALLAEPVLSQGRTASGWRSLVEVARHTLERRPLILLALGILLMASLRSHSRGGLLSLGATAAVMAFLVFAASKPRLRSMVAVFALAVAAAWALATVSGGGTLERIGQIDANYDVDEAGRLAYWQVALGMVAERPWQGYGYGNFEEAFAQYRDERFNNRVDMAHNTYIEHLVELGIPATLLLYSGPLVLFTYCLRGLFVRHRDKWFTLASVGATTLVALHALVDFSLQIPAVAVTYAVILGVGVAQAAPSAPRLDRRSTLAAA